MIFNYFLRLMILGSLLASSGPLVVNPTVSVSSDVDSAKLTQLVYFLKDGQRVPSPPRGWPPRFRPKFYPA